MGIQSKVEKCPKCESTELGRGKQSGYAILYPANKFGIGSPIEYIVCASCGYIIEGYVIKPEKFKDTF